MSYQGKHAAELRANHRAGRRLVRPLPLALALVVMTASLAWASHAIELSFDPGSTVTAGTVVTVKGDRNDGTTQQGTLGNFLEIWQCFLPGDIPTPYDVCEIDNPETGSPDGTWVRVAQVSVSTAVTQVTYAFDTTGLGGITAGFKAVWVPEQSGQHPGSIDYGNVVINVPSNGQSHPGCNGIENAYEQVTTNNGATQGKGKGAQALEKVAEKLGCDLG